MKFGESSRSNAHLIDKHNFFKFTSSWEVILPLCEELEIGIQKIYFKAKDCLSKILYVDVKRNWDLEGLSRFSSTVSYKIDLRAYDLHIDHPPAWELNISLNGLQPTLNAKFGSDPSSVTALLLMSDCTKRVSSSSESMLSAEKIASSKMSRLSFSSRGSTKTLNSDSTKKRHSEHKILKIYFIYINYKVRNFRTQKNFLIPKTF